MNMIRKTYPVETKAIDAEAGIYEVMISTESVDRVGDIVRATGGKVDNYLRNPVVLLAHDYSDLPVAKTNSLEILPGRGLKSTFQFPAWGTYDKADTVRRLWDAGFINAASIGFIPLEAIPLEKDRTWGPQDYVSWELLEWSIVTVPANQDALRMSIEALSKRGRVLSAANEAKIKAAVASLQEVLDQLESVAPQEESIEVPGEPPVTPPNEAESTNTDHTERRNEAEMDTISKFLDTLFAIVPGRTKE